MSKCVCAKCGKTPSEINEYVTAAAMDGYATAEDYVRENEGTFDPVHNGLQLQLSSESYSK